MNYFHLDKIIDSIERDKTIKTNKHKALEKIRNLYDKNSNFDITAGQFANNPESFYENTIARLYFYNKYQKLPNEIDFIVTLGILDYFAASKNWELVKIYYSSDLARPERNLLFRSKEKETKDTILISLDSRTFDGKEEYNLVIYGYDLDFEVWKNEFKDYFISQKKDTIRVGLIKTTQYGMDVGWFDIDEPNVDIELNYGSDFYNKHYKVIVDKLNKNRKGICLFDSVTGCGKSFFIKHLCKVIDRKFIYLSDSIISNGLDNPGLIELIASNPGCVLIIEDAEKYIVSREDNPNSLVSNLLNISDGILSDILGFSIILTHNMKDLGKIDSALLRKSRLLYHHKFEKLSITDAQKKIDSLGFSFKVIEPMTLAEIYNLNDDNGVKKEIEKRIGF
jgi:hypothetical protein